MTHGDVVLLPPAAEKLINEVVASIVEAGQQAEVTEVVIARTKLVQITVVGKRAGEGLIAAEVKRRKA